MTWFTIIAAAVWLACSVAFYVIARAHFRRKFKVWSVNDRWMALVLSVIGPFLLLPMAVEFVYFWLYSDGNQPSRW